MTTIYFVRHAEPDLSQRDELQRPLTPKGRADSVRLSEYFSNEPVDYVYSSPYRRAVETVKPLAERYRKTIYLEKDFRERKIDDEWISDYEDFLTRQWTDFLYRRSNGECLQTVQDRNVAAINMLLLKHMNKSVVVGTHENALGTVIRYYTKQFGLKEFLRVRDFRPWIVRFTFNGVECQGVEDFCLDT
ncbi:MAG: histidine phosphatase family protein [Oscillospiraceae bacterium]|jgi:2,3-bisphosphoglycerate-dependent phosphoglycerate mutase|nr:histidine phosphatase family protein [Clostridiales bacterium]MDD4096041.1 histidine phosphatase family protein [Oscillospiraceae bacterium]